MKFSKSVTAKVFSGLLACASLLGPNIASAESPSRAYIELKKHFGDQISAWIQNTNRQWVKFTFYSSISRDSQKPEDTCKPTIIGYFDTHSGSGVRDMRNVEYLEVALKLDFSMQGDGYSRWSSIVKRFDEDKTWFRSKGHDPFISFYMSPSFDPQVIYANDSNGIFTHYNEAIFMPVLSDNKFAIRNAFGRLADACRER